MRFQHHVVNKFQQAFAIVVGGGQVATAVALSLVGQGKNVVMLLRDKNEVETMIAHQRIPVGNTFVSFPPKYNVEVSCGQHNVKGGNEIEMSEGTEVNASKEEKVFVGSSMEDRLASKRNRDSAGKRHATIIERHFGELSVKSFESICIQKKAQEKKSDHDHKDEALINFSALASSTTTKNLLDNDKQMQSETEMEEEERFIVSSIFVCVPLGAVAGCTDKVIVPLYKHIIKSQQHRLQTAKKQLEDRLQTEDDKTTAAVLQKQLRQLVEDRPVESYFPPPIVIASRGMDSAGRTPYRLIGKALQDKLLAVEGESIPSVPLFVLGGSWNALEWASWTADHVLWDEVQTSGSEDPLIRHGRLIPCPLLLQGAASPSGSFKERGIIDRLFQREKIRWWRQHSSVSSSVVSQEGWNPCDELSLLNACSLLTKFGAGLVAACFQSAGRNKGSAGYFSNVMACYQEHAIRGTCQLMHDLRQSNTVQRGNEKNGTEQKKEMSSASSTLKDNTDQQLDAFLSRSKAVQEGEQNKEQSHSHRVINFQELGCNLIELDATTSREALFGKRCVQLNNQAVSVSFSGGNDNCHYQSLKQTAEGLLECIYRHQIKNNFYEGLVAAFTGERHYTEFIYQVADYRHSDWIQEEAMAHPMYSILRNMDEKVVKGEATQEWIYRETRELQRRLHNPIPPEHFFKPSEK